MGGLTGGGSTSQSTTSTQPYIMSGPTVQAADAAAQAQISAANSASMAATTGTNAAVNSLMNEYNTSLQYLNPSINTGNQAAAQYNYMLGLPAITPGAAPTAPTLASAESQLGLTNANATSWINQNQAQNQNIAITPGFQAAGGGGTESNMQRTGPTVTPGSGTFVGTTVIDPITGAQYQLGYGNGTANGSLTPPSAGQFLQQAGSYGTMANGQLGQTGNGTQLSADILQSLSIYKS